MIGVVPAAGKGTRLRPLTETKPKGMVEVAGQPLLTHVFETLLDSSIDRLVVVVGYRAGAIVDHFGDTFEGAPITYVHQREQRGLGHAVQQTSSHVDEPFIVLNGDNMVAGTLEKQIDAHQTTDAEAVLGVERTDSDTARNTGVVTVEDNHITDIVEKPDDPPSKLVTTGCYVLPESIFDALSLLHPSDRGEYELTDAIGVLLCAGATVRPVELDSEWVNVNTQADLKRAADLVE